MPELLSWQTLLLCVLVYGFAPGAALRIICLAFHRDDPRREELQAELHVVPRPLRPIWVAEQLEVALFEGLGHRLKWAATGRIIYRWHLGSGVKQNRLFPESFWIPDATERAAVRPGDDVKLIFAAGKHRERMWVTVSKVRRRGGLTGYLSNTPYTIPRLNMGDSIKFDLDAIIDVVKEEEMDKLALLATNQDDNVQFVCKCCSDQRNERTLDEDAA